MNKQDYFKLLNDDPSFNAALQKTSDKKERQFIKAFTEEFLGSICDILEPLRQQIEKDPEEFKKRLADAENEILTIVSGSSGQISNAQ